MYLWMNKIKSLYLLSIILLVFASFYFHPVSASEIQEKIDELKSPCGAGTELVGGVCQVTKSEEHKENRVDDPGESDNTLLIIAGIAGAAIAGSMGFLITRKKKPSDDSSLWKDTPETPTATPVTNADTGRKCDVCGTIIPHGVNVCPSCGDTYS